MDSEATLAEARRRIEACEDEAALKDTLRDYVGKKGVVAAMLAEIPKLDPADRKAHGQKANALKQSSAHFTAASRRRRMRTCRIISS